MNTSRASSSAELDSILDQIKEGVRSGKYTLHELQSAFVEKSKDAARSTDEFVHDNPWPIMGLAVGVGLVVGLMLHRRCP